MTRQLFGRNDDTAVQSGLTRVLGARWCRCGGSAGCFVGQKAAGAAVEAPILQQGHRFHSQRQVRELPSSRRWRPDVADQLCRGPGHWARAIKTRVTKREMPPWSADQRFRTPSGRFEPERRAGRDHCQVGGRRHADGRRTCPALPKFAEGGWRVINGRPPDVILRDADDLRTARRRQIPVFRIWDKNPSRKTSSSRRCRFCRRTPPSRTTRRSTAASCPKERR